MELVAIRIKIGLKTPLNPSEGRMSYPNFNGLPPSVRGGEDWTVFIDRFGGLHYDKVSGFSVSDDQSPDPGTQFAAVVVPADFADAAVLAFPQQVVRLTQAQFESFHDERAHLHESDVKIDAHALNALRAKYVVPEGTQLSPKDDWDQFDKDAINPDHPSPGINRNPTKTYARFKKRLGFTIKPTV